MKSAYPYFGGKLKVAELVWAALGDVPNYIEPFFGSGAILLNRPLVETNSNRYELINDLDGFIVNFWRAVKFDPQAVTYWVDYPVSETDLHAREGWLLSRKERLLWSLEDPDFYDAKIAGWWAWGMNQSIGVRYCTREKLSNAKPRPRMEGLNTQINYKLGLDNVVQNLAQRIKHVNIYCGDWERMVCSEAMLFPSPHKEWSPRSCGIFFDPPYSVDTGCDQNVYHEYDGTISYRVREWCIKNGENLQLRIVLCGYKGEHELPGWRCVQGKAGSGRGMANVGTGKGWDNYKRERLWLSPGCLDIEKKDLFSV
jgi:DNA adenine methylase